MQEDPVVRAFAAIDAAVTTLSTTDPMRRSVLQHKDFLARTQHLLNRLPALHHREIAALRQHATPKNSATPCHAPWPRSGDPTPASRSHPGRPGPPQTSRGSPQRRRRPVPPTRPRRHPTHRPDTPDGHRRDAPRTPTPRRPPRILGLPHPRSGGGHLGRHPRQMGRPRRLQLRRRIPLHRRNRPRPPPAAMDAPEPNATTTPSSPSGAPCWPPGSWASITACRPPSSSPPPWPNSDTPPSSGSPPAAPCPATAAEPTTRSWIGPPAA